MMLHHNSFSMKLLIGVISLICLSMEGIASPIFTPAGKTIENVAILNNDGQTLFSNPATCTVGQISGVDLKNKESPSITISPYGTAYYEYEVENRGNGSDSIFVSYNKLLEVGSWTVEFVEQKPGTITIPNPLNLGLGETHSFFLKITPYKQKEGGILKIKVVVETLNKDGPIGGQDKIEDITITTIKVGPNIISVLPPPNARVNYMDVKIKVYFDEFIKDLKLTMRMWRLKGGFKGNEGSKLDENRIGVIGEVIKNDNEMEFKPSSFLLPLTTYEVEVMNDDEVVYSWKFSTTPSDFSACVNYPNPFDMTKYKRIIIGPLPSSSEVKIYTIDGMLVRKLYESNGEVVWDGKNINGDKVASGIYIWVAEKDNKRKAGKMTVIK